MSQYFLFPPSSTDPITGKSLEGYYVRIITYDAIIAREIFRSRYGHLRACQFGYDGFDCIEQLLNKKELETLILTTAGVCSLLDKTDKEAFRNIQQN